jgi:hypothetical protein
MAASDILVGFICTSLKATKGEIKSHNIFMGETNQEENISI